MGGESADRGPVGSLTSKSPVGFQSSASRATLPEPEDSEDWYVWEVRLAAPDGEDHAWLVVSGMIERDQINRHLLATDPDFREIGRTRVGGGVEPFHSGESPMLNRGSVVHGKSETQSMFSKI